MIFVRSIAFNIFFFGWALLASLLFAPLFVFSPRLTQHVGKPWGLGCLWLARVILGIDYKVLGKEHMSTQPVIYASKHQSAWDTIIFLVLFNRPAYVLKRELLRLPFWGWYLWRMKMIAIDRSAGASSIKQMIRDSKAALADGRSIVIFPEGTRTKPGAAPTYHPGVIALYSQCQVPVVPVALNSGVLWGKNAFIKRPGTIIIEFLPAIPPGEPKDRFRHDLQTRIEIASNTLLKGESHAPIRS